MFVPLTDSPSPPHSDRSLASPVLLFTRLSLCFFLHHPFFVAHRCRLLPVSHGVWCWVLFLIRASLLPSPSISPFPPFSLSWLSLSHSYPPPTHTHTQPTHQSLILWPPFHPATTRNSHPDTTRERHSKQNTSPTTPQPHLTIPPPPTLQHQIITTTPSSANGHIASRPGQEWRRQRHQRRRVHQEAQHSRKKRSRLRREARLCRDHRGGRRARGELGLERA